MDSLSEEKKASNRCAAGSGGLPPLQSLVQSFVKASIRKLRTDLVDVVREGRRNTDLGYFTCVAVRQLAIIPDRQNRQIGNNNFKSDRTPSTPKVRSVNFGHRSPLRPLTYIRSKDTSSTEDTSTIAKSIIKHGCQSYRILRRVSNSGEYLCTSLECMRSVTDHRIASTTDQRREAHHH